MPRKMILIIIVVVLTVTFANICRAGDETLWTVATTPDALIILDLTGSMASSPAGDSNNIWSNTSCDGTFTARPSGWTSSHSYVLNDIVYVGSWSYKCKFAHTSSTTANKPGSGTSWTTYWNIYGTQCEKIDIAKKALYALLNDSNTDGLNEINAADMTSLGIRLGLMSYSPSDYQCSTYANATIGYTNSNSCIKLAWPLTSDTQTTATPYSSIYCNNATSCASTVTSCTSGHECVVGYAPGGNTPLAYSMIEAKKYLDAHKLLDDSQSCRQKSVILITDGEDTLYNCSGTTAQVATARAKASVMYAKALADAHYNVYVVGFGSTMPVALRNTLNWMANKGKTDNPTLTNSGSTTALTVSTSPCTSSNGSDPQTTALSGYAFMASNPAELSAALRAAITSILEANYSFSSQASVAAARVQEENYIYEASFEPKNSAGASKEPFWTGHLKKYGINSEGGLMFPAVWDAGAILRDTAANSRNMWTYKGSGLTSFNTTNINAADLAVATTTRRDEVVGFYRGESAYNQENWKLGDLFHTNPMAVKTPAQFFYDPRECGATSFSTFRNTSNNIRTADNGRQLMLAGANDGQLHAFRTGTGAEAWSFIPPNLLQKIAPIAHNSLPASTLAAHDYFIDGPIQVADVWLPSTAGSGISKNASDWKTIAVFGEGQGSGNYLWSSSSTCYSTNTTYFSANFSTTLPTSANPTQYYCGFHALDVTNTSAAPTYLWHLNPTTAQAPYLGEAWSKMQIGRVKIGGNEKWVGFIGGGYNNTVCGSSDACNAADGKGAGKGFFVVDLTDGTILWSYTRASNSNMVFSAPASPLPVDADSDGFIDTVYMGDLGGNMWRFRLCPRDNCSSCGLGSYTSSTCTSCGTGQWTGSLLYAPTSAERGAIYNSKQIFTKATATKDTSGNLWVYFGTGENQDPTWKPTTIPDTSDTKNRLYGIKENSDFTGTHTTANLTNITSTTYTDSSSKHGWYINLSTNAVTAPLPTGTINNPLGEKMISDPTVFGGVVYFATYVPDQGGSSACGLAGNAFLYGIKYISGAGALDDAGNKTKYIGHGIGSSILVSYRPGYTAADIYATASGGAGTGALTQELGQAPSTSSMTNILYWKDRRLE